MKAASTTGWPPAQEVCPGGGVALVADNADDDAVCRLRLDASPRGALRVLNLYEDGAES